MIASGRAFLTVVECSEILRCSPISVKRAIASRRLACIKPSGRRGRTLISTTDLQSYLQRCRVAAVGEKRT